MPIARNTTAVSLLAPGVVLGDSAFGSTASFGGASVAENACIINGLEVTNTRQGLGCGSVPFEFYKEFQVKTGGYSAEFGRSTGGLLNAVTKSGGNEWEFTAAAYYSPDSLYAPGKVSRGNGSTGNVFRDERLNDVNNSEFIVTASGPIIKDTLFIYALINPRNDRSQFGNFIGTSRNVADTELRKRTSKGGDNLFWGLKLDWQILEGHELGFFAYSDRNDTEETVYAYNPNTGVVGTDSTGGFLRKRGGEAWSVNYTGYFTDNFYVTALYGQIKTEYTTDPSNLVCPSVSDFRDLPPALRASGCGPGGSTGDNNDSNKQARLDINFDIGNHQLKGGIDYQKRDSTRVTIPVAGHAYSYNSLEPNASIQGDTGVLYTNNTGANQDYVQDRIFVGGGGFSSDLTAFYIEDNWQAIDNLLLTIGLRQDNFESTGTTGKVLTDFNTKIAPRLGFAWDIKGDGDSKLYGTFGTYYLPIANNTVYRAAAGISDVTTLYTFTGIDGADGTPIGAIPVNGTEANSSFTSSVSTIPELGTFQAQEADPFAKDEYILGYSQVLNETMTFGVRGVYRTVTSALDDYCGIYAYPYCVMVVPGQDNSWYHDGFYYDGSELTIYPELFDGVPDPGSLETYPASTLQLPKGKNTYKALQFELSQVSDSMRWNFIYTWSKSEGNFEGAVKSDIGQADAGITQDFDFPALMDGSQGYQPNDRRHVFKLFGSYNFTEAFSMGFNTFLASGRPLSTFGRGYPDHDPNIYGSYGDTFYI
ncbi:MAG: TonB-dependent receptor, partial [Dehalococcoidia bacterium]